MLKGGGEGEKGGGKKKIPLILSIFTVVISDIKIRLFPKKRGKRKRGGEV